MKKKLLLFISILAAVSCHKNYHPVSCMKDLEGARIGVVTGSPEDFFLGKIYGEENLYRFDGQIVLPLQQRRIDAYIDESKILPIVEVNCPEMQYFNFEGGEETDIAFAVNPDNPELCRQLSAFVDSLRATGAIDSLSRRWETREGALGELKCYRSKASGNPLKVAVSGDLPPYNYVVNNENSGFEIEMMEMFAESIGRTVTYSVMNYASVPTDVAMKKSDIGAGMISVTPEHEQKVAFTTPYKVSSPVVFYFPEEYYKTHKGIGLADNGIIKGIKDSFYNNLILEKRYMLIVNGLLVTILLSVFAVVLGTLFGALLCWMRMHRDRRVRRIADVYVRIMRGTPVLVLLLIMYYIVFSATSLNGIVIAGLTFALNMAAYVSEIFRTSIESVDRGQTEAGLTLGFGKAKTFLFIIMPQAVRRAMPVYTNQVVAVILETAIVGYVAVEDLTKASDIIRSRTFDAFFPLLLSAALYFMITWLVTLLIQFIAAHINMVPGKISSGSKIISAVPSPAGNDSKDDIVIKVSHLAKDYDSHSHILKDVNAQIRRGETISIIGPSGTGKSTFLRCLNLLETPTSGSIQINGHDILSPDADINALRMKMGMVFQSFNLFDHLTVLQNITLAPVKLLGKSAGEAEAKAMELLRLVGLADKVNCYPAQLSGGQKQRIAIARALAMEPEILLFDEPTSALDPTMVSEVLNVIRKLACEGMTMLIVTHEMRFAHDVSSRIFYMDEGMVYEEGTPCEIFKNPQREKTRVFINRVRKSEFRITSRDYDYYSVISQFENFCNMHSLSLKIKNNVQHCVDEMLSMFMPADQSIEPDLTMALSYSETTGDMKFSISQRNDVDPQLMEREENTISAAILRSFCRNITISDNSVILEFIANFDL